MYRIIQKNGGYQVQKKSFIFWTDCYYFTPDYFRHLACYDSCENALQYLDYKGYLES